MRSAAATAPTRTIAADLLALARLALPLALSQIGAMLLGVVDTLFVGRVGTVALAAASIGNVWVHGTLIVAAGIVMGVDPLISQAIGAGDREGAAIAFQRALVLAGLLAIPLAVLWLCTGPILVLFGQDPAIAHEAARFVRVQIPTAVGFLVFNVTRQYLAAQHRARPVVVVVVLANLANAFLNWVLVFGHLGSPALGLVGSGLATGITRGLLGVSLLALTFGLRVHEGGWVRFGRRAFEARGLRTLLALGLPIGVQLALEVWAFAIATLLAGRLGADAVAAHSIVLNLASLAFMLPLGLSMGAAVRVGHLVGAGDREGARRNSLLSLILGAAVMSVSAVAFLVFRHQLPVLYGATETVAALATSIFPIAAAFQLFDGTQVVGGAVLRGLGRTRPAAVFNLIGYYGLALPAAWWLAFSQRAGLRGLWWGLALGLAVVAVSLVLWIGRPGAFSKVEKA